MCFQAYGTVVKVSMGVNVVVSLGSLIRPTVRRVGS